MLTRAPLIASAVLALTLLAGCETYQKHMALSPEDAELTTLASAKARPHQIAEVPANALIETNQAAAAELLKSTSKPLSLTAPMLLQDPVKSAKGARLDALIYRHITSFLAREGFTVADRVGTELKAQGKIAVQYTVVGDDAYVTLTMTDPETNAVMSTYDYSLKLTKAMRALTVE